MMADGKFLVNSSYLKGWIRIMKRITLCLLLSLVLLAGCAISPAVSPRIQYVRLNGKEGCLASQDKRPHFAIVTDGSIRGGITVIAHLSVTYRGQIKDPDNSKSVTFCAEGRNIDFGEQRYDLKEGHLFLVTVKSEPFRVEQFKVSEADKISSLVASDNHMKSFFEK